MNSSGAHLAPSLRQASGTAERPSVGGGPRPAAHRPSRPTAPRRPGPLPVAPPPARPGPQRSAWPAVPGSGKGRGPRRTGRGKNRPGEAGGQRERNQAECSTELCISYLSGEGLQALTSLADELSGTWGKQAIISVVPIFF